METTIAIQVIKVYHYDVEHRKDEDPLDKIYEIQTTEIEKSGELISTETDYAEKV